MMSRIETRLFVLAAVLLPSLASFAGYRWSKSESIAYGVTAFKCETEDPRPMRINVVKVDLRTPNLAFTGTGRAAEKEYGKPLAEAKTLYNQKKEKVEPAEVRVHRQPTAAFFAKSAASVDRGGRGLDMLVAFNSVPTRPPYSGDYADPRGLVISDGIVVADHPRGRSPMFVVRRNGVVEIAESLVSTEYPDIVVAHTGQSWVRRGGKNVVPPERVTPAARLGLGLSADRRTLYIVSVDNGVSIERGTGATVQEMNDIFEDLGAADAMLTDSASSNSIVVKDREKGFRILNRFESAGEPKAAFASIGLYLADRKALAAAAAAAAKANSKITAKLQQTRLNVVREKQAPVETLLKGQIRVSLTTEQQRFKRPVLAVAALFDVGGEWRYYDVFVTGQETWSGGCLDHGQTLAQISREQPEVTASAWEKPVYGDPKVGFFRGYGVNSDKAKLVSYRIELWQAGEMLASYESDKAAAKRLGAPEDWYLKEKYRGKISYRWPPPPKGK